MKQLKIIIILGIMLGIISFIIFGCTYHNIDFNKELRDQLSQPELQHMIHSSIYNDPKHIELKLTSMGTAFDVAYVANTQPRYLNPYFPTIHITAQGKYSSWLHLAKAIALLASFQEFFALFLLMALIKI